jgi:hypothetical protein
LTVGTLIEKFRALTPEDYDHMAVHQFGFEKIYSLSENILQEYNPHPSKRSPFLNRHKKIIEDPSNTPYEAHIVEKRTSMNQGTKDYENNGFKIETRINHGE